MKKNFFIVSILLFLFSAFLLINNIKEYNNFLDSNIQDDIDEVDKKISDLEVLKDVKNIELNDLKNVDNEKMELLSVWKKEAKKLK